LKLKEIGQVNLIRDYSHWNSKLEWSQYFAIHNQEVRSHLWMMQASSYTYRDKATSRRPRFRCPCVCLPEIKCSITRWKKMISNSSWSGSEFYPNAIYIYIYINLSYGHTILQQKSNLQLVTILVTICLLIHVVWVSPDL
jgi:hypothetical protein